MNDLTLRQRAQNILKDIIKSLISKSASNGATGRKKATPLRKSDAAVIKSSEKVKSKEGSKSIRPEARVKTAPRINKRIDNMIIPPYYEIVQSEM